MSYKTCSRMKEDKVFKGLKLFAIFSLGLCQFLNLQASQPLDRTDYLQYEKNTIDVFEENVKSVVNVSNIRIARGNWLFNYDTMEVPAGAGSGFVWDKEGHIVTNYHVIKDGDSFMISFHKDKEQYEAKIVGVEPNKDIAVLKLVKKPKQLHPIKAGSNFNLKVGQKAMAIGNPFGLDHTLTSGIISALDRKIQGIGGVSINGMIQTDSSINPGNSGGPLLDSNGNLIGMNTMIYSSSGSSAGIGFAVPEKTISSIVPQLIKHGKVIRPGIGIGLLEDSFKNYFGIEKGIIIKFVPENSEAYKAGLRGMGKDRRGRYHIGDIILEVDGKEVNSYDDIYQVLDKHKVGDQVSVKYNRDGKIKKTDIKLIELKSF